MKKRFDEAFLAGEISADGYSNSKTNFNSQKESFDTAFLYGRADKYGNKSNRETAYSKGLNVVTDQDREEALRKAREALKKQNSASKNSLEKSAALTAESYEQRKSALEQEKKEAWNNRVSAWFKNAGTQLYKLTVDPTYSQGSQAQEEYEQAKENHRNAKNNLEDFKKSFYENLPYNSDFIEKSKYDDSIDDIDYKYINAGDDEKAIIDAQGLASSSSKVKNSGLYREMNDEQIATYNYIYSTLGKSDANSYIKMLSQGETGKAYLQTQEETGKRIGAEYPIIAQAVRSVSQPVEGVANLMGMAQTASDNDASKSQGVIAFSQGLHDSVSQRVVEEAQEHNLPLSDKDVVIANTNYGNVYQNLYDAADQAVRNTVTSAALGGGVTGGISSKQAGKAAQGIINLFISSGYTGQSAYNDMKNGASVNEAYGEGIKDGVINFATEMLGGFGGAETGNMIADEALEEVFGNLLNNVYDLLVKRDEGEIAQKYNSYLSDGLSSEDAVKNTIADLLGDDLYAAGMAAISSGIMGGASYVYNKSAQNSAYRAAGRAVQAQGRDGIATVINEGLTYDVDTPAYKAAQEMLQKNYEADVYEIPEKVSNKKLGKLQQMNVQAKDISAFSKAVENEENSAGLTKTFERLAQGRNISKKAADELVSNKQARLALSRLTDIDSITFGGKTKNNKELVNTAADLYRVTSMTSSLQSRENSSPIIRTIIDSNGNADRIESINKIENGTVYLNTAGGEVVAADSVDFADDTTAQLYKSAAAYGNTDTAKVYTFGYTDNGYSGSLYDYNTGFSAVYMAQKKGYSFDDAYQLALEQSNITPIQAQLAYNAAESEDIEAANAQTAETSNVSKVKEKTAQTGSESVANKVDTDKKIKFEKALRSKKKPGVTIMSESLAESQKAEAELIGEYARSIGREVIIVDDTEELGYGAANGFYENGKIVLALNNTGGVMSVYFGHELFHDIKQTAPKQAAELQAYVLERLKSKADYNYESRFDYLEDKYANSLRGKTAEQKKSIIDEEIAANACFTVFSDENNFTALVKHNRSLARRVRDFFADFLEKIKNALTRLAKSNPEYSALQNDTKAKEKILAMFDEALKASDNVSVSEKNTGIKFSKKISEYSYDERKVIDGYLDAVDNDIVDFIVNFYNDNKFSRYKISVVDSKQTKDIFDLLKIDVTGYSNNINTNAIMHIEKRHGKNGLADKSMKNLNDIARIGFILKNYDSVDILKDSNGNVIYSAEFKTKSNEPAPMLLYKKKINGTYYLVEAVVENKYKKLWVVSAYINKKGTVTQVSDGINTPEFYARNELASSVPTNSISNSEENVKYSLKEDVDVDDFSEEDYTYPKLRKREYNHLKSEILTNFPRKKNKATYIWLASTNSKYYYVLDDNYNVTVLNKTKIKNIHSIKELSNVDGKRNDISGGSEISEYRYGSNHDSNGRNGNRRTAGYDDQFTEEALSSKGQGDGRRYRQNDFDDPERNNGRYSLKEDEAESALLEENEELGEAAENVLDMLRLVSRENDELRRAFDIRTVRRADDTSVAKVAAYLRKQYDSTYKKSDLVSNLAGLYNYITNAGGDIDNEYVWRTAKDIAANVLANTYYKDTAVYEEYKPLRDYIRSQTIKVPDYVKQELGDYNSFRKRNFGRMRLSGSSGTALDEFYKDISADYPEFFPPEALGAEQLENIESFFEAAAPVYYNGAQMTAESEGLSLDEYTNIAAADIFNQYFEVPEVKAYVSESHQNEMQELKADYEAQIKDMRALYRQRYEEQFAQLSRENEIRLAEMKNKNDAAVKKLKEKNLEAVAAQKAHFKDVSRRAAQRRSASKLRESIRRNLNRIVRLGAKPDKKKHIPNAIIESVKSLCEAVIHPDNNYDNYFQNKKIADGMTDSERYMILKDKKLSDIPTATNIDEKGNTIIENWDDINSKAGREKQHLINRIAAQFGAFKEYSNSDIELDFEFSKNNFRESYNKQGKNFDDFAKMFSVFDRVIDNAVGIEVHNRNAQGYKIDCTLENVYVMVSAFKDGDSLVPVKLEIKQFSDKPNKLYVAITSDKIKMTEVWKQGNTDNGVTQNSRSVNISISDLFKKINSENKGLYKYIPLPFKQTQSDIKLREKLNDFRDGFESIKKEDTQYAVISDLYNDFISEQIVELKNTVGGKTIKELSVSELEKIDKLVKMTAQSINNINRLFLKERNAAAQQYANKVGQELKPLRREKVFNNSVKSLMFNSLKPEYFFQYIGSDTLLELYHDLRKGEDIWAVDVSQAREFALEIRKKYGWHNWDNKTKRKFNSVDGEIELTLQERLGIYANSLGEHTKNHLLGGGFTYQKSKYDTIKKKFTRDYNDNGSHRLSEADISDIVLSLSDSQMAYVRDMMKYLSEVMGAKGNEISRVLYDMELFAEKMYYPAKVDLDFVYKNPKEIIPGDKKIKNAGFTNPANKDSSTPIVLMDFDNVWASHVDEMSKYHAFVLPLENFEKVYNSFSHVDDRYKSVKEYIKNAHGYRATEYIDKFLQDINGGVVRSDNEGVSQELFSKFKKNAVFASMSVNVQQLSAIARAFSEMNVKYFIETTGSGFNRKTYDEMKTYAPVAIIKEMGYFDTNMAQTTVDYLNRDFYKGFSEKFKAFWSDGSFRDDIMTFFASKADEITWTHIWNAVKAETKAKYPELSDNSEQLLKKAGERFTQVITKTQVYDSVFSRSGLMRNKNDIVKMATSFMSEPTTSLNMLADAVIQAKRGKISKERVGRVIVSLIATSAFNSLLQSIITSARDVDDDKEWAELYLAQLLPNFIENLNPLNQIIYIRDIINIFKGYDVERVDMSLFSDLYSACKKLTSENTSVTEKITVFAGAVSAFFGFPLKNITREVTAAVDVARDVFDKDHFTNEDALDEFKNEMNSYLGFKLFDSDLENAVKGVRNGDMELYDKYADKVYAGNSAYDLLYEVLKKYGANSSVYKKEKERVIDIKRENGSKNPNPDSSMKSRAIKDYAIEKFRPKEEGGDYNKAESYRKICLDLYGDMDSVNKKVKDYVLKEYMEIRNSGTSKEVEEAEDRCLKAYGSRAAFEKAVKDFEAGKTE